MKTGFFWFLLGAFCVVLRAILAAWLLAGVRPHERQAVQFGELSGLYFLAGFAAWLWLWDCRAGQVARRWARRKRIAWSLLVMLTLGVFLGAWWGVEKGLSDAILWERMKPREAEIRKQAIEEFSRALN